MILSKHTAIYLFYFRHLCSQTTCKIHIKIRIIILPWVAAIRKVPFMLAQLEPDLTDWLQNDDTHPTLSDKLTGYISGLVQERYNSIADALELRLSCTNPSPSIQLCTIALEYNNTPVCCGSQTKSWVNSWSESCVKIPLHSYFWSSECWM